MISLIAAMAQNRVIGRDNDLPWRCSEDMKRFQTLTTNHIVVMGRKTYESIGRALPNRVNVVATRDPEWWAEGCITIPSFEYFLKAFEYGEEEVFVIGGSELYEQAMPYASLIYLTTMAQAIPDGDRYFPLIPDKFEPVKTENFSDHLFQVLVRKSSGEPVSAPQPQ